MKSLIVIIIFVITVFTPAVAENAERLKKLKTFKTSRAIKKSPIAEQKTSCKCEICVPCIKSTPVSIGHGITIIKAVYGANKNWIDVKEQLKRNAKNGVIKMMVSNPNMGGDPAYKVDKMLKLKYKYNGQIFKYWYPEGFTFRIPYEKHPKKIKITIRTAITRLAGSKAMNLDASINGSRKHIRLCTKKRFRRGSIDYFTVPMKNGKKHIKVLELSCAGHDAWGFNWIIFELPSGATWFFSGAEMRLSSQKQDIQKYGDQTSIDFIFSGKKQGTIKANNPYNYPPKHPWVKKVKGIKFN